MPFTVSASPAPLTFTIWPGFKLQLLGGLIDAGFIGWVVFRDGFRFDDFTFFMICIGAVGSMLAIIRRERIEIYPEKMKWETFWLGFPWSKEAALSDVYGVEWQQATADGKRRSPSYMEFYLPNKSVKAGYTLSFEEYEQFREQVRMMYPEVDRRWGQSRIRSKDLTLLNLS